MLDRAGLYMMDRLDYEYETRGGRSFPNMKKKPSGNYFTIMPKSSIGSRSPAAKDPPASLCSNRSLQRTPRVRLPLADSSHASHLEPF
jgi:hypothetical protein